MTILPRDQLNLKPPPKKLQVLLQRGITGVIRKNVHNAMILCEAYFSGHLAFDWRHDYHCLTDGKNYSMIHHAREWVAFNLWIAEVGAKDRWPDVSERTFVNCIDTLARRNFINVP